MNPLQRSQLERMIGKGHRRSDWTLTCLLCGQTQETIDDQARRKTYGDLMAMHIHAIVKHDAKANDFRQMSRIPSEESDPNGESDVFVWTLPNVGDWLTAERKEKKASTGGSRSSPYTHIRG